MFIAAPIFQNKFLGCEDLLGNKSDSESDSSTGGHPKQMPEPP